MFSCVLVCAKDMSVDCVGGEKMGGKHRCIGSVYVDLIQRILCGIVLSIAITTTYILCVCFFLCAYLRFESRDQRFCFFCILYVLRLFILYTLPTHTSLIKNRENEKYNIKTTHTGLCTRACGWGAATAEQNRARGHRTPHPRRRRTRISHR